jgi:hypothetical protein
MSVRSNNPSELETLLLNKMSLKFDLTERGIKRAFASYDKDGNGLLSLREMVDAVQIYLNGIPRRDVKRLMKCYDVNGDGYISFEEFYAMLSSRSATRLPTDCRRRGGGRGASTSGQADNRCLTDMLAAEGDSNRVRYLQELKISRQVDEGNCILSQAKVLEEMCNEMEIEIKERDRLASLDEKYAASCDASLRARKETGKPLFPIYSAMGYKEADLIPDKRNSSFTRGGASRARHGGATGINRGYETDLGGTGSARGGSGRVSTAPTGATSRRRVY